MEPYVAQHVNRQLQLFFLRAGIDVCKSGLHSLRPMDALEKAIDMIGGPRALGKHLGKSRQAVNKWRRLKRLPRTDWTGETNYAEQIEALTDGAVTRDELLASLPRKEAA